MHFPGLGHSFPFAFLYMSTLQFCARVLCPLPAQGKVQPAVWDVIGMVLQFAGLQLIVCAILAGGGAPFDYRFGQVRGSFPSSLCFENRRLVLA